MINGKCYIAVKSFETWNEAALTCRSLGGNLFEPRNKEDNNAVSARMNLGRHWIGVTDQGTDGQYE